MKSKLFPNLNDIVFAERDPVIIEREIIKGYEQSYKAQFGEERQLFPGDPIRLFLESIAFAIVHQRNLIDYSAKMNLLAYSEGSFLDHLGVLVGVERLPDKAAMTTLKFTLSASQIGNVIIPAGTRATPGGGDIVFATVCPAEIKEGNIDVEVEARCVVAGAGGNGFLPGQVYKIVDPLPWQVSVTNTTTTSGGADIEDDVNFTERIQLAPESFSVAGPHGSYEYYARSAHQDIVDVAVVGPPHIKPGYVELYPLMRNGELPSQEILDAVYQTCNAEDVRPLTDNLSVHTPVPVTYELHVMYWIERADATQALYIQSAVNREIEDWIRWQRSKIGRDIIPSRLVQCIMDAGVKRVEVLSPEYRVLNYREVAVLKGNPEIIYGGMEDG